tara:strand:- start:1144 stop:1650 length:507 start_codon:yes stop_codon:yes gene_type:complete
MALLKSTWVIIILVIILIIVVLHLVGRKSVHTEILIKAKPADVWQVMMDKGSYNQWNTVLIPIEGELTEGSTVKYKFNQDENSSSEIPSTVHKIIDNELLNQKGGMAGMLTYDHKYILVEVDEGTKLTIHEDYRGIFVPFWNPAPVQMAYEKLSVQLKERAEKIKSEQ